MRTKTVATLGPSSMNYETMKEMVQYGVRIFRLNFSHSSADEFKPVVKMIRDVESDLSIPLTIMGDLCGPKIRIGEVEGSPRYIQKGERIHLGFPDMKEPGAEVVFISLDIPELLHGLQVGQSVYLSDGMLQLKVTSVLKQDSYFELEALNSGLLTSHKGIAFPGKFHSMPAMTPKDKVDLHEGLDIGLDAVALSFVQTKDDVLLLKKEISNHGLSVPVVAKLERKNAVDNLESILSVTDAVMVARGDLGLECSLITLPVIQKRIIRACRHAQKPSIVATQMLLSMVKNPIPTRAEATDVANAVLDGADCLMLSEETAIGSYPVDSVKIINGIACSAEEYYLERIEGPYQPRKERNTAKYLAYAACLIADNTHSKAIVCHTDSGSTAAQLAGRRPGQIIHALTPRNHVVKTLNYYWGVYPALVEEDTEKHLERVEKYVMNSEHFSKGENVVITSGQPTPGQMDKHTNLIKIFYK